MLGHTSEKNVFLKSFGTWAYNVAPPSLGLITWNGDITKLCVAWLMCPTRLCVRLWVPRLPWLVRCRVILYTRIVILSWYCKTGSPQSREKRLHFLRGKEVVWPLLFSDDLVLPGNGDKNVMLYFDQTRIIFPEKIIRHKIEISLDEVWCQI